MRVTVTAPGKVVLLGEYAVLEGAPALVMAVNRRVSVTLATRPGDECSVSAPRWTRDTARFALGPGGVSWPAGAGSALELARHVIGAFCDQGGLHHGRGPAFDLELDSSALMSAMPDEAPSKLGLGSSAALTVALYRVLGYYAASQHPGAAPDLATLIDIHAGFQGRRGSGLDVAASLHGGLIEYRRRPRPRVRAAALPPDVGYCFVWTGRQAATRGFLADIEQWRRNAAGAYGRLMESLSEVAEAAAASGDGEVLLEAVEAYGERLAALGRASGADIVSAPHRRLAAIAGRYGVVYKPCGAGGGDIGVALSRDQQALARFRAGLAAERFQLLPLEMESDGVTTQPGNE